MKKLKKNQKGFSMVEMLVCVVTLLLIGGICSTGMGISIKSFQESRFESDSQALESTLSLLFSDIFRYATEVNTETGVQFTNIEYEINNGTIIIGTEEGEHKDCFLIQKNPTGGNQMLVGENVYAENLYVSDFLLSYEETTGVFTGNYKIKSKVRDDLSKDCSFSYRRIVLQ